MKKTGAIVGPLAWLLAICLAGCGGNVTVSRGFDSRQVLSTRDSTIQFFNATNVQGQDPTLVYTTQPADSGAPTYWSLNLATRALTEVGPAPPPPAPAPSGSNRYACVTEQTPDGTETLEITDAATGVKTDVNNVITSLGCVGDDGTLSVFRGGAQAGQQVLWTGPYQQLAPVDLPFQILAVEPYSIAGSGGQPPQLVVIAAAASAPNAAGIYTLDLSNDAMAEVVPPSPARAAWAAGAPQAGALESTSVAPDSDFFPFDGHYIYGRRMSDGGTTVFAGPFSSGPATELALFQLTASGSPVLPQTVQVLSSDDSAQPPVIPQITAWQVGGTDGAPNQLLVWDDAGSQMTVCPSGAGASEVGVLSSDGAHVLFRALQQPGQLSGGPLQVVSLAAGQPHTCTQIGKDWDLWADFSGDGSTIAWITKTEIGIDSNLWIANGDGSDPMPVLTGENLAASFIVGTNQLELSYGGDLESLDVRAPTHFTNVAEQLFGQQISVGGSWFVAGYDYSTQDGTGLLGVVNLDGGAKLPISPAVSQFFALPQVEAVDGGPSFQRTTGVYEVVYVVRGRNASSQDGVWVATVRAADLP